jgi:hypothetical protein
MRRGQLKIAGLVLLGVAAMPAAAKERVVPRGDFAVTGRATGLGLESVRRDVRYQSPVLSGDLYAAAPPMVGMPILENLDVGVGLYSVDGARVKERDFRRIEPVSEIRSGARSAASRVAAVGMSVRF